MGQRIFKQILFIKLQFLIAFNIIIILQSPEEYIVNVYTINVIKNLSHFVF